MKDKDYYESCYSRTKKLINPWRKNQARPDKNQKRRRSIGKKLKQKKIAPV